VGGRILPVRSINLAAFLIARGFWLAGTRWTDDHMDFLFEIAEDALALAEADYEAGYPVSAKVMTAALKELKRRVHQPDSLGTQPPSQG
jgi:hypothetical protein